MRACQSDANALSIATQDQLASLKAKIKPEFDAMAANKVADSYSLSQELRALRVSDTATLDAIGEIVAAVKADRDAWLDIS